MSAWHPVTQPPQEVGLYRYGAHKIQFDVRWDGRHFRYVGSGSVVPPMAGDLWKSNETKEGEGMSENNEDWLESKWCVTCKGATCLPGMHEPTILGGKPSIAACILGSQAVEGKITGRDAAKVFATMLMADAVPVPPGPDYISQINALEAERDALRKDAMEIERLRRISWLIGSIFVHGNFVAETVNERELELLLREQGTFWETLSEFDAAIAAKEPK